MTDATLDQPSAPAWRPYGPAVLLRGSCLDLLPTLAASGWRAHACVSDPPYGLGFLSNGWDDAVAHRCATWDAVASCLLPGAHALVMSGDKYYHRLGWAMDLAGFEPRHAVPWVHANGRCQAQRVAGGDSEHENLAPLLAPAVDLSYLGRLALDGSLIDNLRKHYVGALRVEVPAGERYPKNLVHDGSPEVQEVFGRNGKRASGSRRPGVRGPQASYSGSSRGDGGPAIEASVGSAARYFPSVPRDGDSFAFESKPKGATREAADGHPTPKPEGLLRWQCRLVTCYPRQIVLDPFLGSGTTMRAALDEDLACVGVELDEVTAGGLTVCTGYCATVVRRCPEVLNHVVARALAELRLRLRIIPGCKISAWDASLPEDEFAAYHGLEADLFVVREPDGEATKFDPMGKALGLTLPEQRVPLFRFSLDVVLDEHAPSDLAARLNALATWPEVQALLAQRGDITADARAAA